MAGPHGSAADLVFAVVLLGGQPVDEHHLGGHGIAALDVADVIALNASGRCRQFEQLRQILRGQQVLFACPLGALQFVLGVALHEINQVGLLLPLGHRQPHPAPPQFAQPLLQEVLLGDGVLQQQFRRNFHPLHLGIVLLNHRLQNAARLGESLSGEPQAPHQFAGSHLEHLHSRHPLIAGQGDHITADGAVTEAHFLVRREGTDPLQLVPHPCGTLVIQPFGVALHLLLQQLQQFLVAALKHHRHLPQGVVVVLRADLLLTDARTTADVEVEAGAIAVEGLGTLPQGEHPFHQSEGAPQQPHIHVGAVKAIQR